MEKKYQALQTKSFTEGQALADIIKGHCYQADKEGEFFISEFGETVYLPSELFDLYFHEVKIKSYQRRAKNKYQKAKTVPFYLTFFPSKDQDIIDKLEEEKENALEKTGKRGGKGEYIRRLIREDIARNRTEKK